tara:strand:- start:313 stop:2100 length:1788 start_codon:yes stop_codon:yes gene_type:complete
MADDDKKKRSQQEELRKLEEQRLKNMREREALLQSEVNITNALIKSAKDGLETRGRKTANMKEAVNIQKDLLKVLESEQDTSTKLQATSAAINDLLMLKIKAGDTLRKQDEERIDNLIKTLSKTEQIVEAHKEIAEAAEEESMYSKLSSEAKEQGLSFLESSGGAVGNLISGLAKGGGLVFLFQQAFSFVKGMYDDFVKFKKEMGFTVGESVKFKANIAGAYAQSNLLTMSFEELEEAAIEITKQTGIMATSMQTALVALLAQKGITGDVGINLGRILELQGTTATSLTQIVDETKEQLNLNLAIGNKISDTSAAYEILALNQTKLLFATKEEKEELIKQGLELKARGFDLKELNRIKRGGLDIEKSMRDEMKLRLITGKKVNMNALRNAQLFGTEEDIAKAQLDLQKQIGTEKFKQISQNQRLFDKTADMIGQSSETLTNQLAIGMQQEKNIKNHDKIVKQRESRAQLKEQVSLMSGPKFALGGVLQGNSHANGGIQTAFGELEGGEAIINKKSTKLFRPILSEINTAGGGRSFATGGITNGGMDLSGLISEIKGLRKDIQTQPVMINVDGRVVSAISKVQKQQNSVRTTGYGR